MRREEIEYCEARAGKASATLEDEATTWHAEAPDLRNFRNFCK